MAVASTAIGWLCVPHQISAVSPAGDTEASAFGQSHLAQHAQLALGADALMLLVLAVVLAVLRTFTSQHYFLGALTVCYGFVMVRGMDGKAKASESIIHAMRGAQSSWVKRDGHAISA